MTREVTLSMFGLKSKGDFSLTGVAVFIAVGGIAIYLVGCLTLYCIDKLTGLLPFTWMNALYMTILLIVGKYIFSDS